MGSRTKIHTELTKNTTIKSNYTLFADGTSIDINNITNLKQLLDIYTNAAKEYSLIIRWAKVMILTKQKLLTKFQNHIRTLPRPYNLIQCVTKSEIIGHMMAADNNLTTATNDRLQKEKRMSATMKNIRR